MTAKIPMSRLTHASWTHCIPEIDTHRMCTCTAQQLHAPNSAAYVQHMPDNRTTYVHVPLVRHATHTSCTSYVSGDLPSQLIAPGGCRCARRRSLRRPSEGCTRPDRRSSSLELPALPSHSLPSALSAEIAPRSRRAPPEGSAAAVADSTDGWSRVQGTRPRGRSDGERSRCPVPCTLELNRCQCGSGAALRCCSSPSSADVTTG